MTIKRTSRTQLLRPACLLLLGLGGAGGCAAYPTVKDVPVNCSVENGYEFDLVDAFDKVGNPQTLWGFSGDSICNPPAPGDASVSLAVEPIKGEARCGSTAALVLRASHCNDWGGMFGFNSLGVNGKGLDRSKYEGMSFWARAPGNTSKGFTLLLDDANTAAGVSDSRCKAYAADGGVQGQSTGTIVDQNGNVISGVVGAAPLPDQCGNSYVAPVVVTSEWAFYPVPFSSFTQTATPNRVPNSVLTETGGIPGTGLLTSALWNLILRFPKESNLELWIDNLAFYRKATPDAGPDSAPN